MKKVMNGRAAGALVLLAVPAMAAEPAVDPVQDVRFEMAVAGPGDGPMDHFVMMRAEESFETRLVKGAPYQAEAVTEFGQTLADGNRITRRSSSTVARDSEGRTRREHGLAAIGPLLAGGPDHRRVFIHDPVAGVSWVLEPNEKVARKMSRPSLRAPDEQPRPGAPLPDKGVIDEERIVIRGPGGEHREHVRGGGGPFRMKMPKLESEALGTKVVEGVDATGTRSVITIAAGEMGNERPIEIVTERWYSPELKTVVMSRHSDPRMGETIFRLTQLSRGEPDRALFEVPSDYTVKEGGPGHHIKIQRRIDKDKERK